MIDYETTKSKMEQLEPLTDSELVDQQKLLKRIATLEYEVAELSRLLNEHLDAQKPNPNPQNYRHYRLWS
jgi:hypothetical protein